MTEATVFEHLKFRKAMRNQKYRRLKCRTEFLSYRPLTALYSFTSIHPRYERLLLLFLQSRVTTKVIGLLRNSGVIRR